MKTINKNQRESKILLHNVCHSSVLLCMIVLMILSFDNLLVAQYSNRVERTLGCCAPRFLVKQGEVGTFALRSTNVSVRISGVIADVLVRQVYANNGSTPAEALYVFPASTRAAVYAMRMTVGKRVIKARVREKEKARQEYQQARSEGKAASLLEQIKPNVFSMNVANIGAKDSIVVEMNYTEAIDLEDGEYEFVYPGVVGPRYVNGMNPSEFDAALSNKDLPKSIPGTFAISTEIYGGVPVKTVTSPSHQLDVKLGISTLVKISAVEAIENNRDVILKYRLAGRSIESGLLVHKDSTGENYFMLMVQPPQTVELPSITAREFIFIVDVSGSMQGTPIAITNNLMGSLFKTLRPTDKFNIMAFSGGQKVFAPSSVLVTPENIASATTFLNSGYGGGSTEVLQALTKAFAMPAESNVARSFVVVTDGYVTVEREAYKLVREKLGVANVYSFGIGSNVNRLMIETLAYAGNAAPMIVTNFNDATAASNKFRAYIDSPVMTGMSVNWGKMDVYDVNLLSIPSLTAKRPIVLYGKWKGTADGSVSLKGMTADGVVEFTTDVAASESQSEHSALRYLWARDRIRRVEEEGISSWSDKRGALPEAAQKEITSIGLKYNLLTEFTSFVAVDSVVTVDPSLVNKNYTDTTHTLDESEIVKDGEDDKRMRLQSPKSAPSKVMGLEQKLITRQSYNKASKKDVDLTAEPLAKRKLVGQTGIITGTPNVSEGLASDKAPTGVVNANGGYSVRGSRAKEAQIRIDNSSSATNDDASLNEQIPYALSQASTPVAANSNGVKNNPVVQPTTPADAKTEQSASVTSTQGKTRSESSVQSSPITNATLTTDLISPLSPGLPIPRLFLGLLTEYSIAQLSGIRSGSIVGENINLSQSFGTGWGLGISGEYILGRTRQSSIIVNALYSTTNFTHDGRGTVNVFDAPNQQPTTALAQYMLETQLSQISLRTLYRHNIGIKSLSVFGGVALLYSTQQTRQMTATIDGMHVWMQQNQEVPFSVNGSTATLQSGSLADATKANISGIVGVQYEFLLWNLYALTPYIQYEHMLKNVGVNSDRMYRFSMGLRLMIYY